MYRKYSVIFLILAISLSSCIKSLARSDGTQEQILKLTLRLEQQELHVGEPVIATVTMVNIGKQSVVVNSRMSINLPPLPSPLRELAFKITLPTGESYYPDVVIDAGALYSTHFLELKPGESFEKIVHLNSYGYQFIKAGVYVIVANYQNTIDPKDAINSKGNDDNRIAWKGELDSNAVELTILP
jgi:hypothetical protein